MIYPNTDTAIFCDWLENSSYYRYSTSRVNLIAIIKAAAVGGTSVTMAQWNDFIRITGFNYPAFLEAMAFLNTPQYQFSMNRKIVACQNTDVSHTGDTNEFILASLLIPAGIVDVNSKIIIESAWYKTNNNSDYDIWLYTNTTPNSLAGAKAIGNNSILNINHYSFLRRQITCKNALNVNNVFSSATSDANDMVIINNLMTALNANFAVDQYIIATGKVYNLNDIVTLADIQVYVDKP